MRLRAALSGALAAGVAFGGVLAADAPTPAAVSESTDYIALAETYSQPVHDALTTDIFEVPMFDGETLHVEVTRPDDDGQYPVVMEVSPYHGTIADRIGGRIFPDPRDDNGNKLGLPFHFAPRGYAVAIVDLRGTGRSTGCLDQLGPKDGKDIKTIVEWAADAPWSTGKVGLTGHSYVGSTPKIAAAVAPRGLATIVPSAGLASMYDHQFHNGVPWNLQYAGPIFAYQTLALTREVPGEAGPVPVLGYGTGDNAGANPAQTGCGLPSTAALAGPGQVTGMYEDWHAQRDWRDGAAKADIPIFIVHGVNDNAARIPAAEWFFGDRAPNSRDKVWIGQWDHGSGGNSSCPEADDGGHPNCRFDQWKWALTGWFDKTLKGMDVDTGPAVEAFFDDEMAWNSTIWDSDGARIEELHLDANTMTMSTEAPTAPGQAVLATASAYTVRNQGGSLEFASEPFEQAVTFVGLPKLNLNVSEVGQISQLVTILHKVDASGQRTPMNYCAVNTHLRNSVATPSPVVPGVPMDLSLQCFTMAHHIEAGESLVLEIGTTSVHHVATTATDAFLVHTGPNVDASYRLPTTVNGTAVNDVFRFEDGNPLSGY
jgi:putative CocE/NonD family hydrolase